MIKYFQKHRSKTTLLYFYVWNKEPLGKNVTKKASRAGRPGLHWRLYSLADFCSITCYFWCSRYFSLRLWVRVVDDHENCPFFAYRHSQTLPEYRSEMYHWHTFLRGFIWRKTRCWNCPLWFRFSAQFKVILYLSLFHLHVFFLPSYKAISIV